MILQRKELEGMSFRLFYDTVISLGRRRGA